jgi:hypothetical protein
VREDFVGVVVGVEAVPVDLQCRLHAFHGAGAEFFHDGEGGVAADEAGGADDGFGFIVFQAVWAGEEVEDDWADRGQGEGFVDAAWGQEGGGALLDFVAGGGVDFGGVFQAGGGEQVQAGAVFGGAVAAGDEAVEQGGAFVGAGVGDGHADDVFPLVVVGVADQ